MKMISFFIRCIMTAFLLCYSLNASALNPDKILGKWKVIDEVTGQPTGQVTIKKDKKTGLYFGVPSATYKKGRTLNSLCEVCPGRFKNKPIKSIPVLWNFSYNEKKKKYTGGYALHFLTGKVYDGSIKLTKNGNSLHMRGSVIGAPFLSKTNIWLRVK